MNKFHLLLHIAAATELDKSTVDRLRKIIESSKIAKEYKSLKVNNKVHPDLLGGVIVDFGDEKTIDLSVKSRVQKLDQLITGMSYLIATCHFNPPSSLCSIIVFKDHLLTLSHFALL